MVLERFAKPSRSKGVASSILALSANSVIRAVDRSNVKTHATRCLLWVYHEATIVMVKTE